MRLIDYTLIEISAIWIISEIILNIIKGSKDTSKDQSSHLVMTLILYLCPFLGVYLAISHNFGHAPWGVLYLNYLGLTLIILGLALRWAAVFTLKRQFTVKVTIVKDHQIIDTGIYHYLRHPAYAGSLLSFLGLALYFGNWLSFIIIFLPVLWAHLYRIAIEEKVLENQFGQTYIDYAKKTKRLIPKVY